MWLLKKWASVKEDLFNCHRSEDQITRAVSGAEPRYFESGRTLINTGHSSSVYNTVVSRLGAAAGPAPLVSKTRSVTIISVSFAAKAIVVQNSTLDFRTFLEGPLSLSSYAC